MKPRVIAVVVLYRPDAPDIHRQFLALSPQVDGIVYYDNGQGREGR